jgi:hypothetical protein
MLCWVSKETIIKPKANQQVKIKWTFPKQKTNTGNFVWHICSSAVPAYIKQEKRKEMKVKEKGRMERRKRLFTIFSNNLRLLRQTRRIFDFLSLFILTRR